MDATDILLCILFLHVFRYRRAFIWMYFSSYNSNYVLSMEGCHLLLIFGFHNVFFIHPSACKWQLQWQESCQRSLSTIRRTLWISVLPKDTVDCGRARDQLANFAIKGLLCSVVDMHTDSLVSHRICMIIARIASK